MSLLRPGWGLLEAGVRVSHPCFQFPSLRYGVFASFPCRIRMDSTTPLMAVMSTAAPVMLSTLTTSTTDVAVFMMIIMAASPSKGNHP